MAFLSVKEADKPALVEVARRLGALGFSLLATRGTAAFLQAQDIACEGVNKVREGSPHCVDRIVGGDVSLVINTTEGKKEIIDSFSIRPETLMNDIPYVTTMSAARAAVGAIEASAEISVQSLQAYHGG